MRNIRTTKRPFQPRSVPSVTFDRLEPRAMLAVSATFVAGTGILAIFGDAADDTIVVGRSAEGNILFNGNSVATANVGNTNSISIRSGEGLDSITIDQSNGKFTPGKTAESGGLSEIEFQIDGGGGNTDILIIQGTNGFDLVRLGTNGISLNNDNDVDIGVSNIERVSVFGNAGDDFIDARGNNVVGNSLPLETKFFGGPGIDQLFAGTGIALLDGGAGNDRLDAFRGKSMIVGGDGDDEWHVEGSSGGDSISVDFDSVSQTIVALSQFNSGVLIVDAASGIEVISVQPGVGADTVDFSALSALDRQSAGIILVSITDIDSDADLLRGSQGVDVIRGGAGDSVFGFAGNDLLSIESLIPNTLVARIFGGAGNDEIALRNPGPVITDGGDGDDHFLSIRDFKSNEGIHTVIGNGGNDRIYHTYTVDSIRQATVNGRLIVPTSQLLISQNIEAVNFAALDLFSGMESVEINPSIRFVGSSNSIQTPNGFGGGFGNGFNGQFGGGFGTGFNGQFGGGFGTGFGVGLGGSSGNANVAGDKLDFSTLKLNDLQAIGLTRLTIRMAGNRNDEIRGTDGADLIFSHDGQDTVIGNGGNDLILGGNGNDELFGGAGDDQLLGEAGNDNLFGQEGNDTLDGGTGTNVLDEGPGQGGVAFHGTPGNDVIRISRQVINGLGHVIATINGRTSVQPYAHGETIIVFAGAGNDYVVLEDSAGENWQAVLHGGAGNDTLRGAQQNDVLFGDSGDDRLFGEKGDDILTGGDGDDRLFGGEDRDLLIGGRGRDWLFGFHDDDLLIGGFTAYDHHLGALRVLSNVWKSAAIGSVNAQAILNGAVSIVSRIDLSLPQDAVLFDDFEVDRIFGQAGRDLFFAGINELVYFGPGDEQLS